MGNKVLPTRFSCLFALLVLLLAVLERNVAFVSGVSSEMEEIDKETNRPLDPAKGDPKNARVVGKQRKKPLDSFPDVPKNEKVVGKQPKKPLDSADDISKDGRVVKKQTKRPANSVEDDLKTERVVEKPAKDPLVFEDEPGSENVMKKQMRRPRDSAEEGAKKSQMKTPRDSAADTTKNEFLDTEKQMANSLDPADGELKNERLVKKQTKKPLTSADDKFKDEISVKPTNKPTRSADDELRNEKVVEKEMDRPLDTTEGESKNEEEKRPKKPVQSAKDVSQKEKVVEKETTPLNSANDVSKKEKVVEETTPLNSANDVPTKEKVVEKETKSLAYAEDDLKSEKVGEFPEDRPTGDDETAKTTDDKSAETSSLKDLDPKGNCSKDIKTFCDKVPSSAVDCIAKQLRNEEDGNTPVTGVTVSDGCKQEWRAFKIAYYKIWSLDEKIEGACHNDMDKFCSSNFHEGGPLACLRENKEGLSQSCQDEVFRAEQDAVHDFKMDPLLAQKCSDDADQFCKGITPGGGRVQACLREHISNVSYICHAQLFRQEVENAGDLRLNVELYKACLPDKMLFCPTVDPGKSRLKDCLENNRLDTRFSKPCKAQFDKMLARRSSDYRLNPVLREQCSDDINLLCDDASGDSSGIPTTQEPKILHCLEDFRDDLKGKACKAEVHRLLALAAEDYHFDKEFSDACEASKRKLCNDVENDKVLSCLQEGRETLGTACRAAVFKMEWRLSGDIDYKVPMKRACVVETKKFCDGLRHDHGDIIDCLQLKVDDEEMGSECRKEIVADQLEAAKDYRLNYRIFKDCQKDVRSLCDPKDVCTSYEPCGGKVLKCLQEKVDSLGSDACKRSVVTFEIKESKNLDLNLPFQKACADDLLKYCGKRRSGRDHSKALTCLRARRSKLTKACQAEELRFSMMEASDIRLTPSLMNACGAELRNICPNVSPLNGEAFKCLQLNLESINMGSNCKVEVDLQAARQASDYRLDVRVRNECKEDVTKLCDGVGKNDDGHAAVMKCFVHQFRNLSGGCQTEVAYASRMALWEYQYGAALTSTCDDVAKQLCNSSEVSPINNVYHGVVGQCLITQRKRSLPPDCKFLVMAATRRGAFTSGNSSEADLIATLLKYNELRGGGDLTHSGVGVFWVTTMVAFVAILAVTLFRRYSGPPKTYTLVVKGGDL